MSPSQANLRLLAARDTLARANQRFDRTAAFKGADGHVRHKCFVSYHVADTEQAAAFVQAFDDVFIPRAIGVEEGDGSVIDSDNVDYIRDVIRTDYLRDSTVTIVLVGACTWARKFVDWEIYASLRDTTTSKHNGLLGILLPYAAVDTAKAPQRLRDNLPAAEEDGYSRFKVYPAYQENLRLWIEDAFSARTTRQDLIRNPLPLRSRNGTCP